MSNLMRCKLILNHVGTKGTQYGEKGQRPCIGVRFGAVWEGSTENQQKSENAIFGDYTPMAEFSATISNPVLVEKLSDPSMIGKAFYVDFTEAPQ